jgi:hypothetical protein
MTAHCEQGGIRHVFSKHPVLFGRIDRILPRLSERELFLFEFRRASISLVSGKVEHYSYHGQQLQDAQNNENLIFHYRSSFAGSRLPAPGFRPEECTDQPPFLSLKPDTHSLNRENHRA